MRRPKVNYKKQLSRIVIVSAVFLSLLGYLLPHIARAVPCTPSPSDASCVCSSQGCDNGQAAAPVCNDTTTNGKVDQTKVRNCLTQSPIVNDIQAVVNFLSAGVGVIVAGVIILGGIQYSIAGDNPQAITAAKKRITDGLIALVAFLFIFAFLQWIIPGGIFG